MSWSKGTLWKGLSWRRHERNLAAAWRGSGAGALEPAGLWRCCRTNPGRVRACPRGSCETEGQVTSEAKCQQGCVNVGVRQEGCQVPPRHPGRAGRWQCHWGQRYRHGIYCRSLPGAWPPAQCPPPLREARPSDLPGLLQAGPEPPLQGTEVTAPVHSGTGLGEVSRSTLT